MNLEELKTKMREVNNKYADGEEASVHLEIDHLLLEFINDTEVDKLYAEWLKWYE